MRAAGRSQRQATTANRQASARDKVRAKARGLASSPPAQRGPSASPQPMLVYTGPDGRQIAQPVAIVQQPGQAGAQVIPTGAPQKSAPLFSTANRQAKQQQQKGQQGQGKNKAANGNARRQSGGQHQSGNQRQAGAGRRGRR